MAKQVYPNVPGVYHSTKQGITMTVTKSSIIIETSEPAKIIEIDEPQNQRIKEPDKIWQVHNGIQFINDLLIGPGEKKP